MKKSFAFVLIFLFCSSAFAQVDSTGLNNVFGKKGTVSGGVYKITYPRSDLKVTVGDFSVNPGLALGSWVGMMMMGNEAMMMGDLVLLDSEVPPVVAKLVAEGLGITAIHNHLVNEKPNVKY